MSALDAAILAERTAAVQRHLRRVRDRLPDHPAALEPMTDATDADAFRKLGEEGVIDDEFAGRLARAGGFRNVVVHAYAELDLHRLHEAARHGPDDLVAFLAALRDRLAEET